MQKVGLCTFSHWDTGDFMIFVSHYRMADVSIIHGFLVLLTGIMLLKFKKRSLRVFHATLGILTSIYGIITYLVTP